MTPHEIQLIKKLEEQVNNLAHILAGTQAGESQAWQELNELLMQLKIKSNELQ